MQGNFSNQTTSQYFNPENKKKKKRKRKTPESPNKKSTKSVDDRMGYLNNVAIYIGNSSDINERQWVGSKNKINKKYLQYGQKKSKE